MDVKAQIMPVQSIADKQGAIADGEKAAKLDRQPAQTVDLQKATTAIEKSVPLDFEFPDIGF